MEGLAVQEPYGSLLAFWGLVHVDDSVEFT